MQQNPINNSFSKIFKYLLFIVHTSLKFQKKKEKEKKKSQIWLYCTFPGTEKGEDVMGCSIVLGFRV
jgi:hypothetical protein